MSPAKTSITLVIIAVCVGILLQILFSCHFSSQLGTLACNVSF